MYYDFSFIRTLINGYYEEVNDSLYDLRKCSDPHKIAEINDDIHHCIVKIRELKRNAEKIQRFGQSEYIVLNRGVRDKDDVYYRWEKRLYPNCHHKGIAEDNEDTIGAFDTPKGVLAYVYIHEEGED